MTVFARTINKKGDRLKGRHIAGYALVGSALIGLIAAGSGMLQSCKGDMVDSVPLPPALPKATIIGEPIDTPPFLGSYTFHLEWSRSGGTLSPDNDYPLDSSENIDAINDALDKWLEYVRLTDPIPGYKKPGMDKVLGGVFKDGKLDNSESSVNGDLVIPRYWPQDYIKDNMTPSKALWDQIYERRVKDFKAAKKDIEDMMAVIKDSPLYEVAGPNDDPPLEELCTRMDDYIRFTDTGCKDRTEFDIESGSGFIDRMKSGPLYEYYFGFIPPRTEDYYVNSEGPFVY